MNLAESINKEFNIKISQLKKIDIGFSNEVYKGLLEDKQVIVRLRDKGFDKEKVIFDNLSERGIPIPKLYYYSESPTYVKKPVMVIEHLAGKPLGAFYKTKDDKQIYYKKAGELMKKIHEWKLEGFGRLILKNEMLLGTFTDNKSAWMARYKEYKINDLTYLINKELVDNKTYEAIMRSLDVINNMSVPEASFIYGDMHQEHIFIKNNSIEGLIDFSNGFAGDPNYDIAYSLFYFNNNQRKAFLEGYGLNEISEKIKQYLIYVAADKVSWRHQMNLINSSKEAQKILLNTLKL